MKKNYRRGIMKIDAAEDEVARYNRESLEEISLLPYFEPDSESSDNLTTTENDGVKSGNNDK